MPKRLLHTLRSNVYIPTLKDVPKEAVLPGYQYLLRAGYIRKTSNGIYSFLPLAMRSLTKLEHLIDQEMQSINCFKTSMPNLLTDVLWKQTGRWESTGAELIRLTDRHGDEFCLAPTHEEIFTELIANTVSSHNQLPVKLYQVGRKFRDEIRPRFGLLRAKEFIMKDAYSFDLDQETAIETYDQFVQAYHRILKQLGRPYVQVEADSGNIGGSLSHEFHLLSDYGEDSIVSCSSCGYAANTEKATSRVERIELDQDWMTDERISRSYFKTSKGNQIVQVAVPKGRKVNTLVLENLLGEPCSAIRESPTSIDMFLLDESLAIPDTSDVTVGNFCLAQHNDNCSECDSKLIERRGIEVGHVFYLGDKYSKTLQATFIDREQKKQIMKMGCFGLGVSRLLAAVVESSCDEKGIQWPESIAPFTVVVVSAGKKHGTDSVATTAIDIAKAIEDQVPALKNNVMLDNRWKQSPGSKLAEAELVGYPYILVVGRSFTTDGKIEVQHRASGEKEYVSPEDLVSFFQQKI